MAEAVVDQILELGRSLLADGSSFCLSTSMPSRWIEPESGSWRVAMVRMRKLLPAPLGPTRPNMLLPMESDKLLIALTPFGYVLERPTMVRAKRGNLMGPL